MWPISLLWTVLAVNGAVAATTCTARTGTTSGRARRGGVRVRMCVLLLLLVLLQVVVWMMVGVMATVVVHHHLLLMMVAAAAGAAAATATSGQFLLAVDAARQQHYRTIGPLLQRVVLHRDWIAIVVSEVLKEEINIISFNPKIASLPKSSPQRCDGTGPCTSCGSSSARTGRLRARAAAAPCGSSSL